MSKIFGVESIRDPEVIPEGKDSFGKLWKESVCVELFTIIIYVIFN